ncbi:MAG: hypothetical protein LBQ38_01185, partial [Spirochaetaceae bacterium]|nr:hypothetical protein [Spirochaetaceae bacterium]
PIFLKKSDISYFCLLRIPHNSRQASGCWAISADVKEHFFEAKYAPSIPKNFSQLSILFIQVT